MSDPITTDQISSGVGADLGRPSVRLKADTTETAAQRDQIKRLAQEFEAMLMTQMLRDMRRSMLSDESTDGGLGRETMTDTMDVELGRALSNVGGFGLSNVLLKALERSLGTTQSSPATPASVAPPTATAPGACAAIPAATPAVGQERDRTPDNPELKIPDGHVTSGYGWRRDPFTGAPQFHKGIDVAARYGQDIPAVAAGHVVFAGHQGTYGTTVVVDHGTGQQTRYAHLSAAGVKAGDHVETGQVIGKAGASGRTTGTHVHFEVMTDGQATDPADHH